MTKKEHVQLSEVDQRYLEKLLSKGNLAVKIYKPALGLLKLNRGYSYSKVAQTVGVTLQTLTMWAHNYQENGLALLLDKARSGRLKKILSVDEAEITALAGSEPPAGYSQWSLRLLAEHQEAQAELVKIKMVQEAKKSKGALFDLRMKILPELDPFESGAAELQLHHLEHNRQVIEKILEED